MRLKTMGHSYPEVEEMASHERRDNLTFRWFRVDQADERLALASGLIAVRRPSRCSSSIPSLFVNRPIVRPSVGASAATWHFFQFAHQPPTHHRPHAAAPSP